MLTRRHFLYGAAGVAALAAVGGGAAWAAGRSSDDDALKTLRCPKAPLRPRALEKMESYEDAVTLAGSAKLPFGTLVWCSDDAVAACLLPTETAKPLAEVGLLDLVSAECTTILEHAVGEAEGFEIYDVRANAAGVIWTEADILDSLWRVYAAPLSGTTLGEPQLLDEDDVNWEMPTLAVAGAFAFWQRLPQLDGNARVEDSLLKRAAFGTANVQMVYASQGRMACAPTSCGDSLTLAPRARTSGTYYQLTHLDAATGEVTDACVLPSSMKPMECGWGKTGFSFAFDGIYNYGEGIANLGTYLPMESPEAVSLAAANTEEAAVETGEVDAAAPYLPIACANPGTEAYSDVPWFHFAANPLSPPCWCGNWLMVRGGSLWWPSTWQGGDMRSCPLKRVGRLQRLPRFHAYGHARRHLL
ncbi:MAG: twin-arginine translocation signal domain-containing protein [Adlercreutzia equolifaciens]